MNRRWAVLAFVLASCEQLIDAGNHPDGGGTAGGGTAGGTAGGSAGGSAGGTSGGAAGGTSGGSAGGTAGGVVTPDAGDTHWLHAERYGDVLPQEGVCIGTRPNGDTAVAGRVAGYIDFGQGQIGTGVLGEEIFVARPGWSRPFGGTGTQDITGLSRGVDDSIVLTGVYSGDIDFDAGQYTSAGSHDIFLTKLSSSGATVWSRSFGSSGVERAYSVSVGPNNEVAIAGAITTGAVDFGGGGLSSAGSTDMFVAHFRADGGHDWSQRWGNSIAQLAKGVAIHHDAFNQGSIAVAGEFQGQLAFGSGTLTSAGGLDVFLLGLDMAGNPEWAKRWGDSADQHVSAIAIDPLNGFIAVAGTFQGTVDFGSGLLVCDAGVDGYVAVFQRSTPPNTTLYPLWSRRFGGADDQEVLGIAFDYSGNLITVGDYRGELTLGTEHRDNDGGTDLFVAKHSGNGSLLWLETAGDGENQKLSGVSTDTLDHIHVIGTLSGSAQLGATTATSLGSSDVLIGELRP